MPTRTLYQGPLTDSSRWDRLHIRSDDVFVVTPPKCGTTWMQTIVALLLSGDPEVETDLTLKMPWIDIRFRDMDEVAARLEAMPHRRSMKSQTPLDGLPLNDQSQYLCVFRHPLDAHVSMRNHVRNVPLDVFDPWYPADDPAATFKHFLTGAADDGQCDAMPLAHILRHYLAARALADRPNVTLFHYDDMRRDLPGVFATVAALLGVRHSDELMQRLVQVATFDHMKENATRYAPAGGKGFFRSDTGFFHSGTSGQWRDVLTAQDIAAYDAAMDAALSAEDRAWLENGSG